ncbi:MULTISPECIES: LPD7 domain-containing protein [Sphingomonadales]|jgi:hypothetical protein|uniref:Large polyvalent protein-associated domain-containing protein n=5 Tax=Sphingomonadaceae TaxID=41297 RepID=K9CJV8_SPHYA|nr:MULTISPECIES: LPD7 domain-containing protein [Sphingomonadaceae]EKU72549.1 hypothetical protein HMPREF9718_04716 [Sphingobium yanoikuyae ATCC 51230]KFD26202.1 DNA transfer protein [Sphingobium yanoikuyae]MBB4049352.1 hypothetical protein [Sphingomonas zeae]MDK8186932.1 DNA transfer protein [Sphingomonas zeae]MDK8216860.1 DNA transfer protein [Sphingomonas sp. UMB7805-LC452B]
MAAESKASAPRRRTNGIAIDDKTVSKAVGTKDRSDPVEPEIAIAPTPPVKADARQAPTAPSVVAGDLPEAVRKRYYADKAKWSGDPAYFTSADAKDPAFRDQGRRLLTANESQEVVKDMVAIAQHRGWDRIHITGSETFRRAAWLEASRNGLEVRGYKPNERDLQELDRVRGEASKNSIAPITSRDAAESRDPAPARRSSTQGQADRAPPRGSDRSLPNDRAIDSQLRVMEAVVQRTLFDNPEAIMRVMGVARAQLQAHVAAGRTIKPAEVRDRGPSVQRSVEPAAAPARGATVRPGREHKPPERNRAR